MGPGVLEHGSATCAILINRIPGQIQTADLFLRSPVGRSRGPCRHLRVGSALSLSYRDVADPPWRDHSLTPQGIGINGHPMELFASGRYPVLIGP